MILRPVGEEVGEDPAWRSATVSNVKSNSPPSKPSRYGHALIPTYFQVKRKEQSQNNLG